MYLHFLLELTKNLAVKPVSPNWQPSSFSPRLQALDFGGWGFALMCLGFEIWLSGLRDEDSGGNIEAETVANIMPVFFLRVASCTYVYYKRTQIPFFSFC